MKELEKLKFLRGYANLLRGGVLLLLALFLSCAEKSKDIELNPMSIQGTPEAENTLTILHFNDFHGHLTKNDRNKEMGLAEMAGYADYLAASGEQVIFLNAGDLIQGSVFTTFSDGEAMIEPINNMNLFAMAVGNHEFDYGFDQTKKIEGLMNFPFLSNNVRYKKDDALAFRSHFVYEINGINIGFFGVTTPETAYKTHPDNVKDLYFEDIVTSAQTSVDALKKEGVDIIIAITHLGIEGNDTSLRMVQNVEGIDLVIDGHSHTSYGEYEGETLIVQAGEYGKFVGSVKIAKNGDGAVDILSYELHSKEELEANTAVVPNAAVAEAIERVVAMTAEIAEEEVANAPVVLNGVREDVRTKQTNLGSLISDSIRERLETDVALFNGGGIRATIDEGPVTKGEVLTVLPFGSSAVAIELSGSDVLAAIENGLSEYPTPRGAFPQVSGMTVRFDSTLPPQERVVEIMIGGAPLDLMATYTMATIDFTAAGGDEYTMLKKPIIQEGATCDAIFIDYLNGSPDFENLEVDSRIVDVSATS